MAKLNIKFWVYIHFSFWLSFLFYSCSYCDRYIRPLDFKGRVINKYIDNSYKNVPRIIISSQGKEFTITPDGKDTLSLWMHIKVGDSIIKEKGSLKFSIIRNGESKKFQMKCY